LALTPGTRLGVYEVTAQLGAGGMGEVYRATDSNLKRSVAIKVLPASVADDVDRLVRFQREAEVLAALNHPNIAAIYGLEKTPDFTVLVMELVEGEDLSQRIARGAMPIDDVLPIARQIADALAAAHEQGIIHRDLKPANIKVRDDGTVKVLDFGLAKAIDSSASTMNATMSPTISLHATQAGIILGTVAYMSPEQAAGKSLDQRSDIWSFGCVLFEMITGRAAFVGDALAEILGAVLSREPDWSRLPVWTPSSVRRLLRRTLTKDVRHRLSDIRDARIELEEVGRSAEDAPVSVPVRKPRPGSLAFLAITATLLVALAIPAYRHVRERTPTEMRVELVTPSTTAPLDFALSPDGTTIAFVASGDGPPRLWVRTLDRTDARVLTGTDGASLPFWSPEGLSIGYFARGKLYRVDIAGGVPQALANAPVGARRRVKRRRHDRLRCNGIQSAAEDVGVWW
jgi:serine/threonine protein kinase